MPRTSMSERSRLVTLTYKALERVREPLAALKDSEVLGLVVRALTGQQKAMQEDEERQGQKGQPKYDEKGPQGVPEGHWTLMLKEDDDEGREG